jgi:hypothetical protein
MKVSSRQRRQWGWLVWWVMTNLVPGLLSIDASRFGGSMKRISAFVLSEPTDEDADDWRFTYA